MTQTYHTSSGNQIAAGENFGEAGTKTKNGLDTIGTCYYGATDPSSGASPAWGASECGRLWLDCGVDGSVQNPVLKRWQQLTSGPTYGWRHLRGIKQHELTAPVAVTLSSASPITADVLTFTDKDLSTEIDTVTDNDDMTVVAVRLRVRVREAGTIKAVAAADIGDSGADGTIGGLHFRQKGTTVEQAVIPVVSGLIVERDFWLGLDSSEVFQFAAVVGSASPSLAYDIQMIGYREAV